MTLRPGRSDGNSSSTRSALRTRVFRAPQPTPPAGRGCGPRGTPSPHRGEPAVREPLAIYIHWPFCLSKCPYCDFNSHVREGVDAARWTRALAGRSRPSGGAGARSRSHLDLFRRRHAVLDAARDGCGAGRAGQGAVAGRARSRSHAGGQPQLGRGGALRRVCRGRDQPAVARDPGARSGGAALSRPRPRPGRGDRGDPPRPRHLRALFVRPDLCPARPERSPPGRRSSTRR